MLYEDPRAGLVIRASKIEDVAALKGRLRPADEGEIVAFKVGVEDALAKSFEASAECYTVELRGVPVGMFGIVSATVEGSPFGNIWFLGADEMRFIKKSFVKLSRRYIAESLLKYSLLSNMVDSRYESAVKWLKSCGAQFQPEPVDVNGVPFLIFAFFREA